SCRVGKEGHPARLMAAESAGILQNATSRQRSVYALAQLGFVDADKLLNSICRNDFVLGTVPEQCHSSLYRSINASSVAGPGMRRLAPVISVFGSQRSPFSELTCPSEITDPEEKAISTPQPNATIFLTISQSTST